MNVINHELAKIWSINQETHLKKRTSNEYHIEKNNKIWNTKLTIIKIKNNKKQVVKKCK
jgi:hypothetical protein